MFQRLSVWLVIGSLVAGHPEIALANGDDVTAPAAPGPVESSVTPLNAAAATNPAAQQVALNNFVIENQGSPVQIQEPAVVPTADTNLPAAVPPANPQEQLGPQESDQVDEDSDQVEGSDEESPPLVSDGEEQDTPTPEQQLSNAVRDLDSPNIRVRDAAAVALFILIASAEPAELATLLPGLVNATQGRSLEVRRRVEAVVRRSLGDRIYDLIDAADGEIKVRILFSLASWGLLNEARANWLVDYLGSERVDPLIRVLALIVLSQGPDENARLAIAEHGNRALPPEILTRLLTRDFDNLRMRKAVARHPNTLSVDLARLLQDEDELVRIGVARHPNTLSVDLARLSQDENWFVRIVVARHPNVWLETLAELAGNENADVASAAQGQLTLRLLRLGGVI